MEWTETQKVKVFQHILEPTQGVYRFVIHADLAKMQESIDQAPVDEDKGYGWVESRVLADQVEQFMFPFVGFDTPFNLVTSVCTDGWHRPVFDLDFERDSLDFAESGHTFYVESGGSRRQVKIRHNAGRAINTAAFNSTNHLHLYSDEPMLFTEYQELLGNIPGEDARKYADNVARRGFGALRPPWIKKGE